MYWRHLIHGTTCYRTWRKDDKIASLREQVKKLEDDKKKLIVQLVDYEELKSENERLKKQLAKK